MRSLLHWVTALVLLLGAVLAWSGSAFAQQYTPPIITTPTPTPLPRPEPDRALVGENEVFLPVVVGGTGVQATDVYPGAFDLVVLPADTLWSLALELGRDLDTMACTTRPLGADAATLTPGETIRIPALNDLCYTVVPGDTLAGIAAHFGLTVEAITDIPWNGFTEPPYVVQPRQRVLLPGVRPAHARPDPRAVSRPSDDWAGSPWPDWPYGDGKFIWPVSGVISQDAHPGHWALDIAVPTGTPVKAADRGRVILSGWSTQGYGFRVVIDHGNDYVTLYAHLSDIYVDEGEVVGKGQVIGVSGANGNVTGPHLHFEIRDFGNLTDPLGLLP